MIDHIDRHASRSEHLGIAQALIPQRIEAAHHQGGRRKAHMVLGAYRCGQGLCGQIPISGNVFGEPPHGPQLQEVSRGVFLQRRPASGDVVEIGGRIDQELVGDRRTTTIPGQQRQNRTQVAAGTVTGHHQPPRIDPEFGRVLRHPAESRPGVVYGRWKGMLGGKPVLEGHHHRSSG